VSDTQLAEPRTTTQKERLLAMFHQKATWSNFDLRSMQPAMFQYPARIWELQRDGYNIVTTQDPNDRRKFYYTLHPKTDLFFANTVLVQ